MRKIQQLLTSFKRIVTDCLSTLTNIPITISKIHLDRGLNFIAHHTLKANVCQYALPLMILSSVNRTVSEKENLSIETRLLSYITYLILLFRLTLRLRFFTLSAILGTPALMQEAFDSKGSKKNLNICINCEINLTRISHEISLVLHFFFSQFVLFFLEKYLSNVLMFTLDSYFKGFFLFQYPLMTQKICADHQIKTLFKNQHKLIGFGASMNFVELLLTRFLSVLLYNSKIAYALSTNVMTVFSMVHAYQMEDVFNFNQKSNDEERYDFIDPLYLSWMATVFLTQTLGKLLNSVFDKKKQLNGLIELGALQVANFCQNQTLTLASSKLLLKALIPSEIRSLESFCKTNPFAHVFLRDIDHLMKIFKNKIKPIDTLKFVQPIPFVNRGMIFLIAQYLHAQTRISPKFLTFLIEKLQDPIIKNYSELAEHTLKQLNNDVAMPIELCRSYPSITFFDKKPAILCQQNYIKVDEPTPDSESPFEVIEDIPSDFEVIDEIKEASSINSDEFEVIEYVIPGR